VSPAAGGTCVEMAANQGNWRPLLGLLRTHAPGQGLRSHAALLKIADDLLNSQCLPCVDGSRGRGYPPCSRCMNDPLAHTVGADFHQCMRVLVAMGLNVRGCGPLLRPPLPSPPMPRVITEAGACGRAGGAALRRADGRAHGRFQGACVSAGGA